MDVPTKILPSEVEISILLRLPMKSLFRFRCVSKGWLAEISSQNFTQLYLHANDLNSEGSVVLVNSSSISTFNFSSTRIVRNLTNPPSFCTSIRHNIVGASNGLVCFRDENLISVYNPATRAHRVLPHIGTKRKRTTQICKFGFGYDQKSDDYKILKYVTPSESYIYRLKDNSWEDIIEPSPFWNDRYASSRRPHMILSNNALHWKPSFSKKVLHAFDLETEQFYRVPLPKGISKNFALADVKGYLHLVSYKFDNPFNKHVPRIQIWVMKECEVRKSWTQLLRYCCILKVDRNLVHEAHELAVHYRKF